MYRPSTVGARMPPAPLALADEYGEIDARRCELSETDLSGQVISNRILYRKNTSRSFP